MVQKLLVEVIIIEVKCLKALTQDKWESAVNGAINFSDSLSKVEKILIFLWLLFQEVLVLLLSLVILH